MNQLTRLQKQAIDCATKGEWQQAVEANEAILVNDAQNISALNRLGFCYMQLGKKKQAIEAYEKVLEIEKLNGVAKKYLEMLKKNITMKAEHINASEDFVEEPGKSKVIQLHRLAGNVVTERLMVAMRCELKSKGRFVTVTTKDGEYIGSLPEDISKHLSQLMKTGNKYECLIRSVSKSECAVFIKETLRSSENEHIPSFVSPKVSFSDDILLETPEEGSIDSELSDEATEVEFEETDDSDDTDTKEQIPLDVLGQVLEH